MRPTKTMDQVSTDLYEAYCELACALEAYVYGGQNDTARLQTAQGRVDALKEFQKALDNVCAYRHAAKEKP